MRKNNDQFMQTLVQREARKLNIEGAAQRVDQERIQIVACGSREAVEELIDAIYKGNSQDRPENVEVEPFMKERNFRGVFRVID